MRHIIRPLRGARFKRLHFVWPSATNVVPLELDGEAAEINAFQINGPYDNAHGISLEINFDVVEFILQRA